MVYDNTTLELCHDADDAVKARFAEMLKRRRKGPLTKIADCVKATANWLRGSSTCMQGDDDISFKDTGHDE